MEMPEVHKCFRAVPLKHGTYLIALFAMVTGFGGLAVMIIYGIAEDSIESHVARNNNINNVNSDLKKIVLLSFGMTSLLLSIGGTLLFVGVSTKSRGAVESAYIILFVMNLLLMAVFIAMPVSCFFMSKACVIKEMSTPFVVAGYLLITIYMEIWFYFISVAWNHAQEL